MARSYSKNDKLMLRDLKLAKHCSQIGTGSLLT